MGSAKQNRPLSNPLLLTGKTYFSGISLTVFSSTSPLFCKCSLMQVGMFDEPPLYALDVRFVAFSLPGIGLQYHQQLNLCCHIKFALPSCGLVP